MPRIETELKLDFKDVLVRPKRSTIRSRADVNKFNAIFITFLLHPSPQVDLSREYIFRNSKCKYNGVPIIASNMDTTGTFEMAAALSEV